MKKKQVKIDKRFTKKKIQKIVVVVSILLITATLVRLPIVKASNREDFYNVKVNRIDNFSFVSPEYKRNYSLITPWYSNMLYNEKYSENIKGFKALHDDLMHFLDGDVNFNKDTELAFILLLHYYFAFNGVDRNCDGEIDMRDSVANPFTVGFEKYGIEPSDTFISGYDGLDEYGAQIEDYYYDLMNNWGCTGKGIKVAIERYYEWWMEGR